jgi:hypothetical protein
MDPLMFTEGYFTASAIHRNKMRKQVFRFFLEEGEGSMFKAEVLMWEALDRMEEIEAYEECAILKDILKSIGTA